MLFPFIKKNNPERKYYFGLFLKEKEGIGLVIELINGETKVIAQEKFLYTDGWINLLEDVDNVLLNLENKIKHELKEVIFFVYSHLIDSKTKDIKKTNLSIIKDLVKKLEMKALGYIECYEAVSGLIEAKEEMPLTAILIEFDQSNLGLFVYRNGKLIFNKITERTANLINDLTGSLNEFNGKSLLPARIIIYDSVDLNNESSEILEHKWSNDLFIQLPRVDIIKEDEMITALVSVFKDQLKISQNIKVHEEEEKKQVMGFVINGEIQRENKLPVVELPRPKEIVREGKKAFSFKVNLDFFKTKASIIIGLIIILTALFLDLRFFHKASLKLYYDSQTVEKETKILANINSKDRSDVPIFVASVSADFTENKPTTGKKEIGEKAKGEVSIHNFDDKEKILAKNTVIEAQGIKFSLDNEVKVASSSLAADGSVKLPGKTKGSITAIEIGPEANLAKGQRFKIDDLSISIYFAINDSQLSGGTRKEIRTVSKKDLQDLQDLILKKAKSQKNDKSGQILSKDDYLIKDLTQVNLTNLKYSKETGEEGDTVSLQAKADTKYYSMKDNDLREFILKELKQTVNLNYDIDKARIIYSLDKLELNNDKITMSFKARTKTIKNIAKEELKNDIYTKDRNEAENIIKSKYQMDQINITIQDPLVIFKNRLPFFKGNISLDVLSK